MGGEGGVGRGGGRGGDGWEVKGWGGRRCMLAWEQCDGSATREVEIDNLRCVCSRLRVAKVTQCGRCCLLLHALNGSTCSSSSSSADAAGGGDSEGGPGGGGRGAGALVGG